MLTQYAVISPLLQEVISNNIIFNFFASTNNAASINVQHLFPVETLQPAPLAVKLSHSLDDLGQHLKVQQSAVPCFIISAALCPRHCIAKGRDVSGQRIDRWQGWRILR
jgi:hypothetical protein